MFPYAGLLCCRLLVSVGKWKSASGRANLPLSLSLLGLERKTEWVFEDGVGKDDIIKSSWKNLIVFAKRAPIASLRCTVGCTGESTPSFFAVWPLLCAMTNGTAVRRWSSQDFWPRAFAESVNWPGEIRHCSTMRSSLFLSIFLQCHNYFLTLSFIVFYCHFVSLFSSSLAVLYCLLVGNWLPQCDFISGLLYTLPHILPLAHLFAYSFCWRRRSSKNSMWWRTWERTGVN